MEERKSVRETGFGKINLHLDITGRFSDGYHRVVTVMQAVSVCDTVTLIPRSEGFFVRCSTPGVPSDEKNLAVKAAMLFCRETGLQAGAEIHIDKQIPMQAGMAGGSADAAATLRALNRWCEAPLSTEALCRMASSLGADVPFCVVGGSAYADGKGDILHAFPTMPDCVLVVACEGEGVSTPWGYGMLDRKYDNFSSEAAYAPRKLDALRAAMEEANLPKIGQSMYNIFEEVILPERPIAAKVKKILQQNGALGAMMSGSGPSVFGIFDGEASAARAVRALEESGFRPFSCRPVGTVEHGK